MKLSPLQSVKKEHGSKTELAKKVQAILTCPDDEDELDFHERIETMSNKKLLRLWNAHQEVSSTYGGKEALVNKIVSARFSGGNLDYQNRISGFTLPKLLELARQAGL